MENIQNLFVRNPRYTHYYFFGIYKDISTRLTTTLLYNPFYAMNILLSCYTIFSSFYYKFIKKNIYNTYRNYAGYITVRIYIVREIGNFRNDE